MRALFAVVTTAVACACFLEPGTGLRGQWGGRLIAIDARASDVRMTLSVAAVWPPHGAQRDAMTTHESFTLRRGASADFSGWACLA